MFTAKPSATGLFTKGQNLVADGQMLQRCRRLPLEQAINGDKSWKTKARVFCFRNDLTGDMYRVRTGPGKPGKSWNFIMAFSRTGKSWKVLEKGHWSWKVMEIC